jgi:hypothetical protein
MASATSFAAAPPASGAPPVILSEAKDLVASAR